MCRADLVEEVLGGLGQFLGLADGLGLFFPGELGDVEAVFEHDVAQVFSGAGPHFNGFAERVLKHNLARFHSQPENAGGDAFQPEPSVSAGLEPLILGNAVGQVQRGEDALAGQGP
ncbi:MAG: hypothetical protein ABSH34_37195, partial [Verrucomicrobiota bacterium]